MLHAPSPEFASPPVQPPSPPLPSPPPPLPLPTLPTHIHAQVGRNCDRGDAAKLPPAALDLCEVEPLRQEARGSVRWIPDELAASAFVRLGELRPIEVWVGRWVGVGVGWVGVFVHGVWRVVCKGCPTRQSSTAAILRGCHFECSAAAERI
jgi:hypothetical protein